jgi:hypothetical protein
MDAERRIRFLYPPLFLFASLLVGIWVDPDVSVQKLFPFVSSLGPSELIGLLTGGGLVLVAAGYFIGSITGELLRFCFWFLRRPDHYEAVLDDETLPLVWKHIRCTGDADRKDAFFAAVTFDHEIIPKSIHEWIQRRWHAFNISANGVTALFLALVIGACLPIRISFSWLAGTATVVLILGCHAVFSWRDTMRMIKFQSRRSSLPAGSTADRGMQPTAEGGDCMPAVRCPNTLSESGESQ